LSSNTTASSYFLVAFGAAACKTSAEAMTFLKSTVWVVFFLVNSKSENLPNSTLSTEVTAMLFPKDQGYSFQIGDQIALVQSSPKTLPLLLS